MQKASYLLILIDRMPAQGPEWLKSVVLDKLSPESGGRPYRDYVDSKTRIEAVEVGAQDFGSWAYVTMAASMQFMMIWNHEPDLDKLRWQQFAGRIGNGAVVQILSDDERTVEQLVAALKDNARNARKEAAEALGKLGDARAVEPLIAALKDDNSSVVRRRAAEALGKLGDAQAAEPLIAALKDADSEVRWRAAETPGKLGDARAVEPLIAALGDKRPNLRARAAEALGKLGDPQAVEPLIAALKDDDSSVVRRRAAEALGKLGDARAVEPLIAALKDDNSSVVRRRAAEALGKLGDARAMEPLTHVLRDDTDRVRKAAAEALEALGWKPDRKVIEEVTRKPAPRTPIQPATPTVGPAVATVQKARVKTNALAIASLVLGIVAIPLGCCYGFGALFGIAALITGLIGHRQAKESGGAQSGEGMAVAGTILGGVSILLGIASLLMFLIVLIAPPGAGN